MKRYRELIIAVLLVGVFILNILTGNLVAKYVDSNFWQRLLITLVVNFFFLVSIIIRKDKKSVMKQLMLPVVLLVLFWDGSVLTSENAIPKEWFSILLTLEINIAFIVLFIKIFILEKKEKNIRILSFIKNFYFEIIICLLFILLSIPTLDSWLSPGAFDYFEHIRKYIANWKCYSLPLDQLKICAHTCQSYGFFMGIGIFLSKGSVIGPRIVHLIMACADIICYSMILRKIFPTMKSYIMKILFMTFAFTPIFFGLVGEINPDFAVCSFLIWLLCANIYDKKVLEAFFAILLCFSKETGIALFGMYMIGKVLYIVLSCDGSVIKRLKAMIGDKSLIISMMGGYIYILLHLTSKIDGWNLTSTVEENKTGTPVNVIAFEPDYIIYKIKQLLSPSFFWILLITFLIGLIINIIVKNKSMKLKFWCPFFMSFIGFIIIHLLYITWTNFRYLYPYTFYANCMFAYGVNSLNNIMKNKKWIKTAFCAVTFLFIFISNFYTLDYVFSPSPYKYNIGNDELVGGQMFYMDSQGIKWDEKTEKFASIGMVYNREFIGIGNSIEEFLDDVDYSSNDVVVLPFVFSEYTTTNNIFFRSESNGVNSLFWDVQNKKLTVNYATDNYSGKKEYEKFNIFIMHDISDIENIKQKYEKIYIIDLPYYSNIINDESLVEFQKKYKSYNYTLNVYKIKK